MASAADPWDWFSRRTFHHSRFADRDALLAAKRAKGASISVCLPTLNEADTVGDIVRSVHEELVESVPLVDEIAVIDSASSDETAATATAAGAVVHQDADILPHLENHGGKGDALWKSLFVLKGDLIVFVDADIREFHPRFVTGLIGPLLLEDGVEYVKAFYERPLQQGTEVDRSAGGRVTELAARPLLNLLVPELTALVQPLAGEYAGTRRLLESVPFLTGYAVEIGLLLDIVAAVGLDAVAQVDVDRRAHRNRPMPELSRMAFEVLQGAVLRLRSTGRIDLRDGLGEVFHQFRPVEGGYEPAPAPIRVRERPPAATVPGYRPTPS